MVLLQLGYALKWQVVFAHLNRGDISICTYGWHATAALWRRWSSVHGSCQQHQLCCIRYSDGCRCWVLVSSRMSLCLLLDKPSKAIPCVDLQDICRMDLIRP